MPHMIIEYSANVAQHHNIDRLVDAVHQATVDLDLAPLAGMRTRAVERENFRVGDGGDDLAFIAIIARIGPGRDADTKTNFIDTVLNNAQAQLTETQTAGEGPGLAIAWSMEVQEIDARFRVNRNDVAQRLAERADN